MSNVKANLCLLLSLFLSNLSWAGTVKHPFYVGVTGGAGSTTWDGLVPNQENMNSAISMSTPIHVKEGGFIWGGFFGYSVSPYFSLETHYTHYPKAQVFFDPMSLFTFDNNERTEFTTNTETVDFRVKILLLVPESQFRVYSSAGIANLHRKDFMFDDWRISPTFGVGCIAAITEHFNGELGFDYTAGFGESQLSPAETFFPFLYSITFRLAYAF